MKMFMLKTMVFLFGLFITSCHVEPTICKLNEDSINEYQRSQISQTDFVKKYSNPTYSENLGKVENIKLFEYRITLFDLNKSDSVYECIWSCDGKQIVVWFANFLEDKDEYYLYDLFIWKEGYLY